MKTLVIALLFLSTVAYSQAPEFFKYQALVRSGTGQIVADKTIPVRITILQGSVNGSSVYAEKHSATSNSNGTINLEIGRGTVVTGNFNSVQWGKNSHFVKVEMDVNQDNVFENVGTTQLLSVPYALYANRSGDEKWENNGNDIFYTKGKIGIGTNSPQETLHINGNIRGNQNGALRINTLNGYLDVGAKNPDYAHFYTNMPYGFYFGGPVTAVEHLIGYKTHDLHLSTQSNSTFLPEKRVSILNSNGYVGIGKTDPQYRLDVNGAINATSILINGSPIGSGSTAAGWTISGDNLYTVNNANVGIGISTPGEKLHINGSIRGNQQSGAIRVNTDHGYLDVGAKNPDYAHFYTDMPYGFYFGGKVTVVGDLIGYRTSDLYLSTQSGSTFQPEKRVTILNSNGYVGIGTQQPKAQLQVETGDIYLNNATSGVIMRSPDNQCWKLTVSNAGMPIFTAVTCPQ